MIPMLRQALAGAIRIPQGPRLAAIIDAVVVPGGRVLVAYRSGLLKLMNFTGKEVWRDQVNGLVAIGEGQSVLLLRDDLGQRHLSVLDTATQRHREIGPFPVSFYHPWASEDGWLVNSGQDVLSLDIPALLAGEEAEDGEGLVQHWTIRMGEPGRPLFFIDKPGDVNPAFQREDGLTEWWWLDKRTLRVTCRFWTNTLARDGDVMQVACAFGNATPEANANAGFWLWVPDKPHAILRLEITRDRERAMIAAQPMDPAELIPMQPMASITAIRWRVDQHESGPDWFGWHPETSRSYRIIFEGAERAWARAHLSEPLVTVFDDLGRLAVVDVKGSRLLMRMA